MLGNWHVRFGGGPLEKYRVKPARQLASGLPYFVAALADRAGPWMGSRNQRVIDLVATRRAGRVILLEESDATQTSEETSPWR